MSCTGTPNCDCGCCAGTSVQTPQVESNLPGLASIAYRAGTWATFNESMLARLSSSDYPALTSLKTRDNDDFTIAFLDATAMVLDILTFYQERLVNESFVRTATQLQSLIELSRLIGYQPSPGVSASAYVAFTLKTAPGQAPNPSATAITIPKGTQLQSVPSQGQTPQTFETFADIQAKPDWNALPVQTGQPWAPKMGDLGVFLQGTATQLQPGDLILIVGDERIGAPSNNHWDVRVVSTVQSDTLNNRTYVLWDRGLGDPIDRITPSTKHPKFFALRQRAALFGYNAVDPQMLAAATIASLQSTPITPTPLPPASSTQNLLSGMDWNFGIPDLYDSSLIDLDAVYPKVVSGGWIVLINPDQTTSKSPAGLVSLYQVTSVTTISRSNFAMSSKISRLGVDNNNNLSLYYTSTRQTSASVQSDELAVGEQPLDYPLYGTSVDLQDSRPDLVGAQVLALFGKRQKLSVADKVMLTFVPADTTAGNLTLNPGDLVTLTDPTNLPTDTAGQALDWSFDTTTRTLNVEDANGRPGTVTAILADFKLAASSNTDPTVSEYALVTSVKSTSAPYPHTQILLKVPPSLANCYDRTTTTVNANVGKATHGQSVSEVMGSGSASTPNQSFTLKQSPLTFIQAPTPSGRLSTLSVQANGVAWTEVPSLYNQGPYEQVYATLNQSGGTTEVLTGDGVEEGATLPTGQNNIQATYRIGLGSAGNVGAGALSTLMDRPLGVSGVTNPGPATGGQDADSIDDVRANAPLAVLTLGRAVSITDYQNYAASFAGIAKAYAIWIPSGAARGVFVTVAGVGGAALPSGNPTLAKLVTSLHNYGNPLIPITAVSFLETLFGFSADLKYNPAYDTPTVQAQVLQALYQAYSFEQRTFGQGVTADELATFIQAVPGVVAVNIKNLQVLDTSAAGDLASRPGGFSVSNFNTRLSQRVTLKRPYSDTTTRICAYLPVPNLQALPMPAEILVLDPDPTQIVLGVMP